MTNKEKSIQAAALAIHVAGDNANKYLEENPDCSPELEEEIIDGLIEVPRTMTLEQRCDLKDWQDIKNDTEKKRICDIDDPDCLSCGS